MTEPGDPAWQPPRWQAKADSKRASLQLEDQLFPWTGRKEVKLSGVPKVLAAQRTSYTEAIDLRWAELCLKRGMHLDSAAPPDVFTDISQAIDRQLVDGGAGMLTSSQIYWYQGDRLLCPLEYFLHNGWPSSISLANVNEPVCGWPELPSTTRLSATNRLKQAARPPKRRRRRVNIAPVAIDLAANGFCLPDVCLVMYTSLLSVLTDSTVFEQVPDVHQAPTGQSAADDNLQLERSSPEAIEAMVDLWEEEFEDASLMDDGFLASPDADDGSDEEQEAH